jgi:hypothetical protein
MFRVYDAGCDPDGPDRPLPPVGALISVSPNREQLWVGSLQKHVGVRLMLEEWDGAPAPASASGSPGAGDPDGWHVSRDHQTIAGEAGVSGGRNGELADGGSGSVAVYESPVLITHRDMPSADPAIQPAADMSAAWDEEAKGQLYLRGQLTIDMGSAGVAVGAMRLVGGVGEYAARVYARNRERVARLYNDLFDRHGDPLGDEFASAKKDLEGIEQYLLQLWRES